MLPLSRNLGWLALASLATFVSSGPNALGAPPVDRVNVVNPATSPAVTSSVDDPGRIPYASTVNCSLQGTFFCRYDFPAVPQGHRLVVQRVSAFFAVNSNPYFVNVAVFGGAGFSNFLAPFSSNPGPTVFSAFDQPVLQYFEAGSSPGVQVFVGSGFDLVQDSFQSVSLSGYLLDCTANLCAPVAH